MINQHAKFVQLQDRLRVLAEQYGDHAFAEALSNCIHIASGDHSDCSECPMRNLLLEDYVQTGQVPNGPHQPTPPALTSQPGPSLPMQTILDRVQALLKRDALRVGDVRYLEALEACEQAKKANPNCPMFNILHKSL
jgi:hypothetical protein